MNKTVLIVGAGAGQVPAIVEAKKLGLTVVTVDRNSEAEGMKLADHGYSVDIIDKEGVLKIAKKHQIDGIITLQSDHGVPAVGYVNDKLNLRGVSYKTAIWCSNKMNTRVQLAKKKCAQPDFYFIKNEKEAIDAINKIGYPCVIKAADSSGSRGVIKIEEREQVKTAITEAYSYSRQEKIIVEEFIEGIEFGAQTFSVNGKCELVLMHNDTLSSPPYMIPIGHSFPFDMLNASEAEIAVERIREAVEAIGIKDGPANIDIILDKKTREVKIIEIGARIGATCLPELVSYYTGINWISESIKCSISEKVDLSIKIEQPVAALIVTSPKDGIYQGFKTDSDKEKLKITEFEITVNKGDMVSILRKGTDRIGKIISFGKNSKEAEQNAEMFFSGLNININE